MVAHGEVDAADRDLALEAQMVIAADGGAFALDRWGILPHLLVGDLDSYGTGRGHALAERGTKVLAFPAEKAESDLELALERAVETGADDIVILGAFSGRLDHELANLLLLADPRYAEAPIRAVRRATQIRALHGGRRIALDCTTGSIVTLLPVAGDARGVTTTGLRYPLRGDTLRFGRSRGLSNEITASPASVSLEHGVLFVIEVRQGGTT